MSMKVIKWDKSMAVRCAERIDRGYAPVYQHQEKGLNKAFLAGEWDAFVSKINKAVIKKY